MIINNQKKKKQYYLFFTRADRLGHFVNYFFGRHGFKCKLPKSIFRNQMKIKIIKFSENPPGIID